MKLNKIFLIILSAILLLSLCACSKGVNILKQPKDYVGEFDVPSSRKVEDGSALSVVTSINENGFKIESAIKTKSDDPFINECYKINSYGVNIEIFEYSKESKIPQEVATTGKFSIKDTEGNVIKDFDAVANGNFVLMFGSTIDYNGKDCTEQNNKVAELFKNLELK